MDYYYYYYDKTLFANGYATRNADNISLPIKLPDYFRLAVLYKITSLQSTKNGSTKVF